MIQGFGVPMVAELVTERSRCEVEASVGTLEL